MAPVTWSAYFERWRSAYEATGLAADTLFREIRVLRRPQDPEEDARRWSASDVEPEIGFWPRGDIHRDRSHYRLQSFYYDHPGSRGPLPSHKDLPGVQTTARNLWYAQGDAEKICAALLAAYLHNPLADQDIEGPDRKSACEIIRTLRPLPPEHARPPIGYHHAVRATLPFASEAAIADAAALAGRPGQYASAVMAFAQLVIDDQMDILSDRQPVYFVFDGTGDPALIAKIEAEITEAKAAAARRRAEAARQAEEARE